MRGRARAVAAAFLLLLLCGSIEAAAPLRAPVPAEPSRKPATVRVTIEGMKFLPADAVARAGDTIVWTNTDVVAHTVTSKSGLFDSKLIPPGGSWKYVARKSGEFDYKCSYHVPMAGRFSVR
ncbi:MAG TPA: cupredoxin family copper-binding protein [Vicinamibacterales bacterium]|jgi:plastocyanin